VYSEKLIQAFEQDQDGPARKLSTNLNDIYRCCVYAEKLLRKKEKLQMMDRGTVRNM
jgi:hypothetical protein